MLANILGSVANSRFVSKLTNFASMKTGAYETGNPSRKLFATEPPMLSKERVPAPWVRGSNKSHWPRVVPGATRSTATPSLPRLRRSVLETKRYGLLSVSVFAPHLRSRYAHGRLRHEPHCDPLESKASAGRRSIDGLAKRLTSRIDSTTRERSSLLNYKEMKFAPLLREKCGQHGYSPADQDPSL